MTSISPERSLRHTQTGLHRLTSTTLTRHLTLAILALAGVVLLLETTSTFRNSQLGVVAYVGIAAGGLTILTGLTGQLSLGHGAFMAIGAYTTALLYADGSAFPLPAAFLVSTLATLLVGVVVGVAAARLSGPYLAGATLALAVALPGLAIYFRGPLGGEQGLHVRAPDVPDWFADAIFFLSAHDVTLTKYVAYLGWIALIVTFVLLANLSRSGVGRNWRALRDDPVAAELAGIDLARARVSAFVVSAACGGLAGAIMAVSVRIAAPSSFSLVLSLVLLSSVVLGGLGSLGGALFGAALLTFLPQLTTSLGRDLGFTDLQAAELAPLVHGVVLVVVILFAPSGFAGLLSQARHSRKSRRRTV